MDNQMLRHLLLSFLSKLVCYKIIDKPNCQSQETSEMDEKSFQKMNEWIPKPHISRIKRKLRKRKNKPPPSPSTSPSRTPKIFTKSFPLDLSMTSTRYLNCNERVNLSLVNSDFYHIASQKMSFYDWDFSIFRGEKKIFKILNKFKKYQNVESLTLHGQKLGYPPIERMINRFGKELTNLTRLNLTGFMKNILFSLALAQIKKHLKIQKKSRRQKRRTFHIVNEHLSEDHFESFAGISGKLQELSIRYLTSRLSKNEKKTRN